MTDAWARSISPADAVVALRSYPRRWSALLASADADGGDDPEGVLRRAPADGGPTVLGHLGATTGALGEAAQALRVPAAGGGGEDDLAYLRDRAEALADAVEAVDADDWSPEALDAVRAAVVAGSEHLRAAERTLREVVGRPPA